MQMTIAHTWDGQPAFRGELVQVELEASEEALLVKIHAPFHGDPPPPGPPGSTPGLWEHEVVEVFLAGPGDPVPYTEIEISPHGHHLVLRLRGTRNVEVAECPLELEVRRLGRRWEAVARLAREHLPPEPWRVNAYALHGQPRRYLAWTPVPGEAPDFHRPEVFRPWTGAPADEST